MSTYSDRILALRAANLIAYWPLAGSAADASGNGHAGAATNVTWGAAGIGDGGTAASFDGTAYINLYSAGLSAAFNGLAGSLMVWFKNPAGGWPASQRALVTILDDSNNFALAYQSAGAFTAYYAAGGVFRSRSVAVPADDAWHHLMLTWDKAANEFKVYLDGAQVGATHTGLGTWSGTGLDANATLIGARLLSPPTYLWLGGLAHVALWDAALTLEQIGPLLLWWPPVTDRAGADINARASKAFWNISDWWRVRDNTALVHEQLNTLLSIDVPQTALTLPAAGSFPAVEDINALVKNVDDLRAALYIPAAVGLVPLKHDYQAGLGAVAPDYEVVNAWERTLDILHTRVPALAEYRVRCGVSAAGQPRFWQSRFRG